MPDQRARRDPVQDRPNPTQMRHQRPSASAGSATRPVTTIWAPARIASAMPRAPEIDVDGDGRGLRRRQAGIALPQLALVESGVAQHVVAADHRDPGREAVRLGQPRDARAAAGRVGRAEIAHDGDARRKCGRKDRGKELLQKRLVALFGVGLRATCPRASSARPRSRR